MAQAPAAKSPLSKNRLVRPPVSELPPPPVETDRPTLWRTGIVVAVCFAIGVAWPLFGGLNFVQRPPGSTPARAEELIEPPPGDVDPNADPNAGAPATTGEVAAMRAAPITTTRQTVRIESRVVQSCQGDAGERVARCDAPNLDAVITAPLATLADCEPARDASGVLSLGVSLDFSRGQITSVKLGQSTTLPKQTASALLACARSRVVGTSLDEVEHEHGQYWVYYLVRFLPPGSPVAGSPIAGGPADADSAPAEVVSASGQATIGFATAVVRDSPSAQAKVAERLSYGTRVNVTARSGEWYRIERAGKKLGWLHRKAIGM